MSVGIPPTVSLLPPSPSTCLSSRRPFLPPPGISLPKLPPLGHKTSFGGSGLTTPPVDDMSTAYQPTLAAYDGHGMQHGFPGGPVVSAVRPVADSTDTHYGRHSITHPQTLPQGQQIHSQPQLQLVPSLANQSHAISVVQPVNGPYASVAQLGSHSRHSTRPSTPSSESAGMGFPDESSSRRGSESLVYHSLQIPKCISPQGGNLAEFAAQMTCFFWFESTEELKQAENIGSRSATTPLPLLPKLAKPHEQFRKWVFTVLSTTQVTQNVILLALLFIYRLKMSTPQIKGRAGSEYRLLTVALMLGNKFLDDNTYTNKTWAEVSCFAVQEIHVMEVEFLSNMRYNLLASKTEWEDWLLKLASFHDYYGRASMPVSPMAASSPSNHAFNSPLPSPTGNGLPKHVEFPLPSTPNGVVQFSPTSGATHNWAAYQANSLSPLATKPTVHLTGSRKRSPEFDLSEHPAKRQAPPRLGHVPVPGMTARPNAAIESARQPVPQLTLMTNPPSSTSTLLSQQPQQAQYSTATGYITPSSGPAPNFVSLPPLQPGVRAMSTVFQPTPATMVQQVPITTTAGSSMTSTYPGNSVTGHPSMGFNTPNKLHSPGNLAPYAPSPMAEYGAGSAIHTPTSNSPSVYLQQRASPYKPIRHVNTLLYPPPSASLDQYHLSVPVQPTQMHYQPLGRRNDVRTGVVPEFVVYNRGHHQPLPSQGFTPRSYQP